MCSPLQNHSLKSCTVGNHRDRSVFKRLAGLTEDPSLVLHARDCLYNTTSRGSHAVLPPPRPALVDCTETRVGTCNYYLYINT